MYFLKNVARNSSIIVVSRVINAVIGLFIIALLSRYLSKDLFGKYILAITFVGALEVFTDMGYNIILVREIARAKDRVREIIGSAIAIKSLVALFSFILIILVAHLFNICVDLSPSVMKAIYILAFAVTIDFMVDIFVSVYRAFERMEYDAFLSAFNILIYLGLVSLVIYFDYGFIYLFIAKLISNIITSTAAIIICIKRYGIPQFKPFLHLGIYLTKEAFPLGTGQVIDRIYTKINILLIRIMKTVVEVGFYGGAYRIVEQLSMISNATVTSVFPILSRCSQSSKPMLNLAYEKTLKLLILMAFPMATGMSVLAERITPLVFGKGLMEISGSLKILSLVIAFSFPNFLFKFVLSSINKQATYRFNVFACFVINLSAAFILIPSLGYIGACYTMLISSFSLFLLGLHSVSKSFAKVSLSEIFLKPAIGSIVMGLFLGLAGKITLFLVIPMGAIIYFSVLVFLKTFSRDEILLLQEMIPYRIGFR